MKKLTKYMLKYWYFYILIAVCVVFAVELDMVYPQITKRIVNEVFVGGDMDKLPLLLFAIVCVGVGRSIFQ